MIFLKAKNKFTNINIILYRKKCDTTYKNNSRPSNSKRK